MMYFTKRNKELAIHLQKIRELQNNSNELASKYESLFEIIREREQKLDQSISEFQIEMEKKELNLINKEKALKKIFEEKSLGFPWLSTAIAEFYQYQENEVAKYLLSKSHPAAKSAELVRDIAFSNKILRKQFKIAQNFVNYYETLFPWITEYVGESLDELLLALTQENEEEEDSDPVLKFIPRAEYRILSEEERNQKALDRYLSSRKHNWQIGRDYERFIGYLYEKHGFKVNYIGIEKGLEDLGRDLICTKGENIEIVQCKCWANHKTIHEKHINQLYGTAVKYYIEQNYQNTKNNELLLFPDFIKSGKIKATFVTSTRLSETAQRFAEALGVKVLQNKLLERYPLIKCNISPYGEKIYHLPFDQQYDKTQINKKGEFYAMTVNEAISNGFRRAFRWTG